MVVGDLDLIISAMKKNCRFVIVVVFLYGR